MANNNILRYLLYFCMVGFGVVIGVFISMEEALNMAESINLIDVASLIVTILLAVYIPSVLDKKLQAVKDKKALIDERVGELQTLYRRIDILVQGESKLNEKDYLIVQNTLDICTHKIQTISVLILASKFKTPLNKELQELVSLGEEYRKLLTSQSPEDNRIQYSDEVKNREELLFNLIDKSTCLLLLRISEV